MTRTGALAPNSIDGSVWPLGPPFPGLTEPETAMTGFATVTVVFAGQPPGLVAGATQTNILVPPNAPTGTAVPLSIAVGGYVSQYNPAVTVEIP